MSNFTSIYQIKFPENFTNQTKSVYEKRLSCNGTFLKLLLFTEVKKRNAYLSHIKVQITASKKDIYLVLVYVITKHPLTLATNKEIKIYFSR